MNTLHLLLALLILWFVVTAVNPKVYWYLRAWQYRDPEANYPSDAWFFMHRLGAVVMIVVCLVMWGWACEPEGVDASSVTREETSDTTRPVLSGAN